MLDNLGTTLSSMVSIRPSSGAATASDLFFSGIALYAAAVTDGMMRPLPGTMRAPITRAVSDLLSAEFYLDGCALVLSADSNAVLIFCSDFATFAKADGPFLSVLAVSRLNSNPVFIRFLFLGGMGRLAI